MARIIISMPDELMQSLDVRAQRAGKSRSALVRSAVSEWVAAQERIEFEELLAAGYREMASTMKEFADDFAGPQGEALQVSWRWDG